MSGRVERLENRFPMLHRLGYEKTSEPDRFYNCFAYAAGISNQWWEPGDETHQYWPPTITHEVTIETIKEVFKLVGFEECADGSFDSQLDKVAIYARNGFPTHAARQLDGEWWSSKCGPWEDIRHKLDGLQGITWGFVEFYMQRRRPSSPQISNIAVSESSDLSKK